MDPTEGEATQSSQIGNLPPDELKLLISQTYKTIWGYDLGIAIGIIFFWLIVPLIMIIKLNRTRKQLRAKLKLMRGGYIPVYRVQGVLTKMFAGPLPTYYVGRFSLPQSFTSNPGNKLDLNSFEGQTVAFEFLPTLRINRSFYAAAGNGYNFITKSVLEKHIQNPTDY